MRTYLCSDRITGTTPERHARPHVVRVLLATLLLLALAQPLTLAQGWLLSSASAAPRAEITQPAEETPAVRHISKTVPDPAVASSASEQTTGDHHSTVAGIPTPLALAIGAVILVLVLLLAITAFTRHRHDGDGAFLDFGK
jgi:hypothetical protein